MILFWVAGKSWSKSSWYLPACVCIPRLSKTRKSFLCKTLWKRCSSRLRFIFTGELGHLPRQLQFSRAVIVSFNCWITFSRQGKELENLASTMKVNSARKANNKIHFWEAISEKCNQQRTYIHTELFLLLEWDWVEVWVAINTVKPSNCCW